MDRPLIYDDKEYNTRDTAGRAGRTEVPRYTAHPVLDAKAPAPAPVASNEFTLKSDLLHVTKRVPAKATLGSTIEADLTIVALANCANVVITDTIPAGTTYVKSDPAAQVNGKTLTWNIDTMDKGQTINAKIWYKADTEGSLVNCATMTAIPRGCAATFVGKAAISIAKSGPETAKLGSTVTYRLVVKNTGNADAENVVVTDNVPDGLSSASGKTLTFNLGTIAAGQSKEIPVALKADARGKHCNTASVATSNAGNAKDDACTVVTQPGLDVTKTGTKEQFIGRNASYQIVVSNTGDTDLKDVIVTDTAPSATKIVSASGASVSGNTATWKLANLAKGGKQNLDVVLTSGTAGTHCNGVAASVEGLRKTAEACTVWRGMAAILIEVVDNPDPIQVGESTTYTVRVTNQGTADDTNIKIVARFGNEITPTAAAGQTAGTVDGRTVTFAPVARLAPKQTVTWTITAKGASAGDHRLKTDLTSDLLKSAVTEEESTHVY